METERSGRPRCGRHALLCIIPSCCSARCCRSWWSMYRSRDPTPRPPPSPPPSPSASQSSPRARLAARTCEAMASRRQRNCREMVRSASAVYVRADPAPATASNDDDTDAICWWYCRYRCST
ncbi:hypothetical protein ACQJBY_036772 [Aegilops geniculata]